MTRRRWICLAILFCLGGFLLIDGGELFAMPKTKIDCNEANSALCGVYKHFLSITSKTNGSELQARLQKLGVNLDQISRTQDEVFFQANLDPSSLFSEIKYRIYLKDGKHWVSIAFKKPVERSNDAFLIKLGSPSEVQKTPDAFGPVYSGETREIHEISKNAKIEVLRGGGQVPANLITGISFFYK